MSFFSVGLGLRIEKVFRNLAKAEQRKGGRKGGKAKLRQSLPKLPQDEKKRTTAHVGKVVGLSRTSYEKAKVRATYPKLPRTRRIAAYKSLGRKTIPTSTARNLSELEDLLKAESDENTCRKNYTPEEAVRLGRRIEKLERPAAKGRRVAGQKSGGRGKKKLGGKLPPSKEAALVTSRAAGGDATGY